jgi:hypothetical protein
MVIIFSPVENCSNDTILTCLLGSFELVEIILMENIMGE